MATEASASGDTRPTMRVSTTPMNIMPTWMTTTGIARVRRARMSVRRGYHSAGIGMDWECARQESNLRPTA